jgi:hypothetical protein
MRPRPKAQDMTSRRTKYKDYVDEEAKRKNTTKARVRAKVEHPFRILKRIFGFTKVRYRGIWKNHQWLCAAFALVNLYRFRGRRFREWGADERGLDGDAGDAERLRRGWLRGRPVLLPLLNYLSDAGCLTGASSGHGVSPRRTRLGRPAIGTTRRRPSGSG